MKIKSIFIQHLFIYIAIIITSLYYDTKNYQCNSSQMLSHSHLKLNTNENVRSIHEKNYKDIVETHSKFKIMSDSQAN